MKNKKQNILTMLVILFTLSLTVFVFCGCNFGKIVLQAPSNLQISGSILTWDKVENASGYIVSVNGSKKVVFLNEYDLSVLSEPDCYEIKVQSFYDNKEYSASDWSQITEYTVEAKLEQNFEFAFYSTAHNNYSVTGIGTVTDNEIVIPSSYSGKPVVDIGYRAFENNVNITKVTLPNTIEKIGPGAFSGCTSLESIQLPNNDKLYIRVGAFENTGLKSLTIPDNISRVDSCIINCLNLEYIKLPNSMTMLTAQFFYNTPKLTSVTLPDSLTEISSSAFTGSSIESVKIPKKVTQIGENAFESSIVSSVEFEEGSELTSIAKRAFIHCDNLKSIVIPTGVKTIGYDAFSDCDNLKSVTFEENSQLESLYSIFNHTYLTEITIPRSVTIIGNCVFDGMSTLKTVRIEDNSELEYLGSAVFRNCSNLTTIDLGKNSKLYYIEGNTFENCTNLTSIELPSTLRTIGSQTFAGCLAIKSIVIPASVKYMYDSVFFGWSKDQTIYIENLTQKPTGWYTTWFDDSEATVVWKYKKST